VALLELALRLEGKRDDAGVVLTQIEVVHLHFVKQLGRRRRLRFLVQLAEALALLRQ
jgi:hypothetical protein